MGQKLLPTSRKIGDQESYKRLQDGLLMGGVHCDIIHEQSQKLIILLDDDLILNVALFQVFQILLRNGTLVN